MQALCCRRRLGGTLRQLQESARGSAIAARRGGVAPQSPPECAPAGTAQGSTSNATRKEDHQPSASTSGRRQFGPEPPPAASEAPIPRGRKSRAAAQPDNTAVQPGALSSAPKRRGRPPKQQQASEDGAQPQLPNGPGAASTSAPAVAAAAARNVRKPFGPEPPPPPLVSPSQTNPSTPILPEDPRQLTTDDILSLPLPDASLGQPLRFDSDDGALAGTGEDDELDYDELIKLATRVDAAAYIERAFERAERGMDPTPDPLADPDDADIDTDALQQAVKAAAITQPSPSSATSSSNTTSSSAPVNRSPASSYDSQPAAGPRPQLQAQPHSRPQPPPGARPAPTAAAAAPPTAAGLLGGGPAPEPMGVYVDVPDEEEEEQDNTGPETPTDPALDVTAMERRMSLLVDLLASSGAELEAKLDAAAPEVDEVVLVMLERRYTAGLRLGQDAATVERMGGLYRALRYIYERRHSSPAERLLDDVLEILANATLQPSLERRRQDAAARLRNAFTGGMLDVDVFAAAAALAEQRQTAAEALAVEQVPPDEFKAETLELLEHAKRVQLNTAESLAEIEAEVERLKEQEPAVLQGKEWKLRLEQVELVHKALKERDASIEALEEVLVLTRAIELQLLTGRMRGE